MSKICTNGIDFIGGQDESSLPGFLSRPKRRAAGNENPGDTKGKDQVYSPLFVKACPSCNYLKVHTRSRLHTHCAKTRTTLWSFRGQLRLSFHLLSLHSTTLQWPPSNRVDYILNTALMRLLNFCLVSFAFPVSYSKHGFVLGGCTASSEPLNAHFDSRCMSHQMVIRLFSTE